jgi:flagellar biosynthesis protein FlhB
VSDSDGNKTEEATPRRLRKAREEGDSGASSYAAQAVGFVVAIALVPSVVRATASVAAEGLRAAVREIDRTDAAPRFDVTHFAMAVVALCVPVLIAAGVAAGIVHVVQTGGVIASRRLGPKLERLDPVQGMKGLLSGTRLFAVARSLLAAGFICWLTWRGLRESIVDIASLARTPTAGETVGVGGLAGVISEAAGALVWRAAFVGLALGVVDLLVTRRSWLRRLRMTKDEVRREHKESEGDPHVKAARRRAYEELLAQATVASVRNASVVVVNPAHLACALRYEELEEGSSSGGDHAPVVIARGEGDLAARIVRAAHDYAVPVVRDVPLARALVELSLGQAIPESLYEAVAAVLLAVREGSEGTDNAN